MVNIMYTYLDAVLRAKGKNKTWKSVNISLLPMVEVFNRFIDGYIKLSNPVLSPDPIYVNFLELKKANIPFYNLTFELWLASLVNTPLPVYITPPLFTNTNVIFSDAVQAKFKLLACKPNEPLTTTGSNLTDICLTKDYIDYPLLRNRVITTVNGILHYSYGIDEHLIIKDGNKVNKTRQFKGISQYDGIDFKVGLISFAAIGDVTQIPIQENMLKQLALTIPFKQAVVIDTNTDLRNKTVFVSIGGYLHGLDKIVDVVNAQEGLIRLNMEYLTLARRVFELKDTIDISALAITESENKPNALVVKEIESNDFITKLLTMSQSFIIVVDTPLMTMENITIDNAQLFGVYEYGKEPLYPLMTPSGRFNEYWRSSQYDKWVMTVSENLYKQYTYETTEWKQDKVIVRHPQVTGVDFARGILLKLQAHSMA